MSIIRKEKDENVIDLRAVFQLLFHKLPIILLTAAVCGAAAFAVAYFLITPKYKSAVTLYVNNKTQQEQATTVSANDLSASAQLVGTYAAIITSNTMLKEVISTVGADVTAEELKKRITIEAVNDTEVFTVEVLDPDPAMSANMANAVADLAPQRISDIVEGSSVKSVDKAETPEKIATPNYRNVTIIGALAGFLLAIVVIIIRAATYRGIKTEMDFQDWDYPLLCSIPDLSASADHSGYGYGYGEGK